MAFIVDVYKTAPKQLTANVGPEEVSSSFLSEEFSRDLEFFAISLGGNR